MRFSVCASVCRETRARDRGMYCSTTQLLYYRTQIYSLVCWCRAVVSSRVRLRVPACQNRRCARRDYPKKRNIPKTPAERRWSTRRERGISRSPAAACAACRCRCCCCYRDTGPEAAVSSEFSTHTTLTHSHARTHLHKHARKNTPRRRRRRWCAPRCAHGRTPLGSGRVAADRNAFRCISERLRACD